ncbi:MAG: hypothetical protein AAF810_25425 [Cyanobacteria bacterium P01_D01_bin.36]
MPRKKPSASSRLREYTEGVIFPPNREFENEAIEYIGGLPPSIYKFVVENPDIPITPHQLYMWERGSELYQKVKALLKSFYSGTPKDLYQDLDRDDQAELASEVALFLSFYAMAWKEWNILKPFFESFGASPPTPPIGLGKSPDGSQYIAELPGKALKDIESPEEAALEFIRYRSIRHVAAAFNPFETKQTVGGHRQFLKDVALVAPVGKMPSHLREQKLREVHDKTLYMPWHQFPSVCYSAISKGLCGRPPTSSMEKFSKNLRNDSQIHLRIGRKSKSFVWKDGIHAEL